MVLLGKKTFWWKVQYVILAPLWVLSESPTKKSWSEYKYGLIEHEHEYDFDKPEYDSIDLLDGGEVLSKYYKCKHHGCNIVSVAEKNGDLTKLTYNL